MTFRIRVRYNGCMMNEGNATDVDVMLNMADGNSVLNPDVKREGLVWKSIFDPNISFKTISNEYLLKEK